MGNLSVSSLSVPPCTLQLSELKKKVFARASKLSMDPLRACLSWNVPPQMADQRQRPGVRGPCFRNATTTKIAHSGQEHASEFTALIGRHSRRHGTEPPNWEYCFAVAAQEGSLWAAKFSHTPNRGVVEAVVSLPTTSP